MPVFALPSKVFTFLRRLLLNYEHAQERALVAIIKHGRIAVSPDVDRYHDFGRDHFGHDVVIYLPPETIAPISLKVQKELTDRLRDDLATCAKDTANDEYFRAVRIELEDEDDFLYLTARSLSGQAPKNPDTLSFWKPNSIRAFISHRDSIKRIAHEIGDGLEQFGVSSFVAHDTIEPTASWQAEIEKALETMEVFIALITEDFHDSVWTNQEVGFARARGIPVVSVKLGKIDPRGFIADKQALHGDLDAPNASVEAIYKLLAEKLGQRDRIQHALITAFCAAPNWNEARRRFERMAGLVTKLSEAEFEQIRTAFEANNQLHEAIYLSNSDRLIKFLQRTTGVKYRLLGGKIVPDIQKDDNEIPF